MGRHLGVLETGQELASSMIVANSFFTRLKGLLGRQVFNHGEALLIYPCTSIHTFFMAFSIDAIFIDKNKTVLKIYQNLPPWKFSNIIYRAWGVIELPAGTVELISVNNGNHLFWD